MAFSKISQELAIPAEATATYTFYRVTLCAAGPVALTMRHAGDGTPAYKRASWHYANRTRNRRADNVVSEVRAKQRLYDDARMLADYCVVSWENVIAHAATEPTPCSPDKVYEFLCALIDAQEGIAEYSAFSRWAADADNFRPTTSGDAVELGKA